jgi:sulfotransferase family protein
LGERVIERKQCPVFVMGCHRSGTNLLYDTLLSSGGFAVYRGYLPVYKVLIPRFGSLDQLENRKKMMATWLRSKGFRRSGLDAAELTAKVLENCRSGGDFLRIVMDEVARSQQVARWAVYDPDTVLRVATIKRDIPEALFVHIIRDGRDIALSLRKMGGFNPFPWSRRPRSLEETALYWEWMVRKGRRYGREIPNDYMEICYEDLVADPRRTLKGLGEFLDYGLDYDRIQTAALGRISETNSSFREEAADAKFNPVQRWKQRLSQDQIASLEWQVGKTLEALGYARTASEHAWKPAVRDKWLRVVFPSFLECKLWLKLNTPLGRFASLAELELSSGVFPQADPPSTAS